MVIDTSALIAILLDELEAPAFAQSIAADPKRLVSAVSLLEASIVMTSRKGATGARELDLLLHSIDATIVSLDSEQAQIARRAYDRFGKGRHPAKLNLGDCCTYALVITSAEPLLSKGNDFPQTDLKLLNST